MEDSKDVKVTESDKDENNNETEIPKETPRIEDQWMIRRSFVYDEEYSDCTSVRARFHQYFIHGKTLDCSQWKRDSINSHKWEDNQDINAANELVVSEKKRRKERLVPHYANDVWKKRKSPPENWNDPLPEYISSEYKNSYLNMKSKEMKGESPPSIDVNFQCSIL